MSAAIEVDNVTRVFAAAGKKVVALSDVSFTVGEGEIVGLLGNNGAGKTTLTKIVSTLLLPTAGTARVFGVDVRRDPRLVRRNLSVVLGGDRGLYGQLSARENLRFFGMLDGLPHRRLMSQIDGALEEVGLIEVGDRKVAAFSRGMRQRLHIAIGMISQPQVLLLDEPTVGLDPMEAGRLREATASLRNRGVSILLTSHYLVDVELLADRVVMLEGGRVTHVMSVGEFSASVGYAAIVVVRGIGNPPDTASLNRTGSAVTQVEHSGGNWKVSLRLRIWTPQVFSDLSEILSGTHVSDVEVLPARLDDAFIRLQTGISR